MTAKHVFMTACLAGILAAPASAQVGGIAASAQVPAIDSPWQPVHTSSTRSGGR